MKNNKGFASTFILFSILTLFLIVMSILLFTMNNSSVLNSGLKNKLLNDIEKNADKQLSGALVIATIGEGETWISTNVAGWELSSEGNTLQKHISFGDAYGTLPQPTKANSKFVGWYTSSGDKVTSETIMDSKGSLSIYSKFVSNNIICVRAASNGLHTEKCNSTEKNCYLHGYYESGSQQTDIITYGRLGSTTLTPGDAFDCDVNNDGDYNSQTERFYYVSRKYVSGAYDSATYDNNYAALIYYTHYKNGAPSLDGSNSGIAYYTTQSNTEGPVTAKEALPDTSAWSNLSAVSTRNITDSSGTIKKANFDYGTKAARLLTLAEIYSACGQTTQLLQHEGFPASCNFMLENTRYSTNKVTEKVNGKEVSVYYTSDGKTRDTFGPWTETAYNNNNNNTSVHRIDGYECDTAATYSDRTYYGARPVIDVRLENIEYE